MTVLKLVARQPHEPTPGDWFVDEDEPDFTISSTAGPVLARVNVADDFPCREEGTDADINAEMLQVARVMAAANDLRAAVSTLLELVPDKPENAGRRAIAQAVLHKAKTGKWP